MTNGKPTSLFARSVLLHGMLQDICDDETLNDILLFHARSNLIFDGRLASRVRYADPRALTNDIIKDDLCLNTGTSALRCELPGKRDIGRPPSADYFSDTALLEEKEVLDFIVDCFGVKEGRREFPSGGALYPNEIMVGIFAEKLRQSTLASGYYHYIPRANVLEQVCLLPSDALWCSINGSEEISEHESSMNMPGFFIVYCCYLPRTVAKYRYRGYRLALMEAGAMFQVAAIKASGRSWKNRVWSMFSDSRLSKLMRLNQRVIFPLTAQLFGP
jgi:SagB-type dehydrogenase family enzyme